MTYYIDNEVVEGNLNNATWTPGTTLVTVASGTLALTNASTTIQIFSGSTAGQIVKLPDATTLLPATTVGWFYHFHNDATVSVAVQDNAGSALFTLAPNQRADIHNTSYASAAGAWTYQINEKNSIKVKAGVVASGSFSGTPKKATVTFTTAFPDTNYAITISGTDARIFAWESKAAGSFVINTNANQALTGSVCWECVANGET